MGIRYDEKTKTWVVTYSKRPAPNMAPVSRCRKGIATEAEARKIEKQFIEAVLNKIHSVKSPKWSIVLNEFISFNRTNGYLEKTLTACKYALEAYTLPCWGNKHIDQIATKDIYTFKEKTLDGLAESNKKYVLAYVRRAFQFAVMNGYINQNPVPAFKFRKIEKLKGVLTREQVKIFLNKAKELNSEWYPHWCAAIYLGARNGELFALTWDKVDFENKRILINSSWNSKDGFKSTKSGDDRYVEIADGFLPILKELKIQSGQLPFVLPRLSKWNKGEQARELRMFLTGIGLPPMRFHDLRATWATLLLGRGMEPIRVMKMGGWKDMETMMIYVRKSGIDLKGCMEGVNFHDPVENSGKILELKKPTGSFL